MIVIQPHIFIPFQKVGFGFSTKIGDELKPPYYLNLSFSVGDDTKIVTKNRKAFFDFIGIEENSVAFQKQVHGDSIKIVDSPGNQGDSDALITTKKKSWFSHYKCRLLCHFHL